MVILHFSWQGIISSFIMACLGMYEPFDGACLGHDFQKFTNMLL
jgi:hypothetical protein